jgi:putative transposase
MSRPPRIPGFSYVGRHRYFLTICAFQRQRLFACPRTVFDTLLQFRITRSMEAFELSAYCFMPDHVHLLIEGLEDRSDFKRFCKLAKQRSGSAHSRRQSGPLWQEGYHDRVLRENDDSLSAAGYLLSNPVRAGLVTTPMDFPYLGSDRWTVRELIEAYQLLDPAGLKNKTRPS